MQRYIEMDCVARLTSGWPGSTAQVILKQGALYSLTKRNYWKVVYHQSKTNSKQHLNLTEKIITAIA